MRNSNPTNALRLRDPDMVASAAESLREFGTLVYTSPVPEKDWARQLESGHLMQTEGYTIFLNPEKKKGPRINVLLARPDRHQQDPE